ncbi:MAG: universal stress protein [Eubacteriales bacterium]
MFNKILVPVDGSDYSFRAVKTAASLVEKYSSEVTLIYVVAIPSHNPGYSPDLGMIPQRVIDDLEQQGNNILNKAKAEFKSNMVNTVMRIGYPAEEIIDEAANGYDLVVMGGRGLGKIKGFLLGSVSDRVSHHAQCAVLIVT